jgi:hypothetical protein
MAKIGWSFFSSRRKITPESLVKRGIVRDYQTYLDYCRGLDVEPLSLFEFDTAFSCLALPLGSIPTAPVLESENPTHLSSPEVSAVDSSSSRDVDLLSATVWLAGVEDAGIAADPMPTSKKSKKINRQKAKSSGNEVD